MCSRSGDDGKSAAASAARAALCALGLAACGDAAVLVEVRGDGLAAGALDAICLGVADDDPAGGVFGRRYPLAEVGELPQSLAIDPGGADGALAWVRGSRLGLEVARDVASLSFGGGELGLVLEACPAAPADPPAEVARGAAPTGSRLAASLGPGGNVVVAIGEGAASASVARERALVDAGFSFPGVPSMGPSSVHPFDADGDCDDDLVVAWRDQPPELWRREAAGFALVDGALDGAAIAGTAASADLDGDGDLDLALGGAGLELWLGDGTGRFARQTPGIAGDAATDVAALGFADLDADGAIDLVVGRGRAGAVPSRVLFNNGSGGLTAAVAALAEVPYQVRALGLGDLNGDGAIDLLLGAAASPIKLYANRGDGRLEDRSFVSLPSTAVAEPSAMALGDWDGDCLLDAVIGQAGAAPLSWRGGGGGALVDDGAAGASGAELLLSDVDLDGDRDLLIFDGEEVIWAAR